MADCCSAYFHARFRDNERTAWENAGASIIFASFSAAILAVALRCLPTPAAAQRLAKGPLFNFKAALIGASLAAPIGITLGIWSAKDQLASNSTVLFPVEKSTGEQIDTLIQWTGINALLFLTVSTMAIGARRWCHPAIAAGASGAVVALYSFVFSFEASNNTSLLVWPSGPRR